MSHSIKSFFLLLILSYHSISYAQQWSIKNPILIKTPETHISFSGKHIPDTVLAFKKIMKTPTFQLDTENVSLQLTNHLKSLAADHFTYIQVVNGIPIYGSHLKVSTDKSGNVISLISNIFDLPLSEVSTFNLSADDSDQIANWVQENIHKQALITIVDRYVVSENDNIIPAYEVDITAYAPSVRTRILFDTSLTPIYSRDLKTYYHDTTCYGYVFYPDPLTSAEVEYGDLYKDFDDLGTSELNAERKLVSVPAKFNNDSFFLESPFVRIADLAGPDNDDTIFSLTDSFLYDRSQSDFEAVNVIYHIHTFQQYIHSLGFTNLPDTSKYQLLADPHGDFDDNSFFTSNGNNLLLHFGDGGVDDAEDADVIVHEYGHALADAASPNSNTGFEREAVDEGFGDYLAASYSKSINAFNWEKVFSWDGHNEYWDGRSAKTNKVYPENTNSSSIHLTGEIWSTVLMDIQDSLGRETTDSIVLEHLYYLAPNLKMNEIAKLLIRADSALNKGRNSSILEYKLCKRGLIQDSNICIVTSISDNAHSITSRSVEISNTLKFTRDKEALLIYFPDDQEYTLQVYTISGRLIYEEQHTGEGDMIFPAFHFGTAQGVYLLNISSEQSYPVTKKVAIY